METALLVIGCALTFLETVMMDCKGDDRYGMCGVAGRNAEARPGVKVLRFLQR